jgi:hypothetical protein
LIGADACAHGHNSAASLNAIEVMGPNGKKEKIKLTPEYIRDRLDITHELAREIIRYLPACIEFRTIMKYIISNDEVVREAYLVELEETKKSMLPPQSGDTIASRASLDNDSSYEYRYHYIMHYDPELYKRDKKSQGKARCGPFTETEIRSYF